MDFDKQGLDGMSGRTRAACGHRGRHRIGGNRRCYCSACVGECKRCVSALNNDGDPHQSILSQEWQKIGLLGAGMEIPFIHPVVEFRGIPVNPAQLAAQTRPFGRRSSWRNR